MKTVQEPRLVSEISSRLSQSVREVRRQSGPWPGREAAAQRGVLALLLVGLVTGPVALGLGVISLRQQQHPVVVTSSAPADLSNDRQVAGSAAARFIRVWWGSTAADREALDGLLVRGADGADLPAKPRTALTAVDVASVQPYPGVVGGWRVRLTVWPAAGSATDFEVLVQLVDGRRAAIVQLPSVVPPPAAASGQPEQSETLLDDDPRTVAAAGFITSWLGGRSDVTRWTVPAWQPSPPPQMCTAVTPGRVTADPPAARQPHQDQTVTLQISCTTTAGGVTALAYDLTLSWGSGQWAVAAINGSSS